MVKIRIKFLVVCGAFIAYLVLSEKPEILAASLLIVGLLSAEWLVHLLFNPGLNSKWQDVLEFSQKLKDE